MTLQVNIREAEALTPAALDWAVPGHLEAKVEHYLRVLPKELRRAFVPLAETAKNLSAQIAQRDRLTGRRETLAEALAFQIAERFRVAIDPNLWADKPPPEHLRVRVRVLDDRGRELCASRELAEIKAALHVQKREASAAIARIEPESWRRARAKWEKPPQTTWAFGEIVRRVLVTENAGVPVYAYPGLQYENAGVALRLFKTPEEADAQTRSGLAALLEHQLGRDLGWLERDLRALRELGPLIATLTSAEKLQADAFTSLRRWLTDPDRVAFSPEVSDPSKLADSDTARPFLTAEAFSKALVRSQSDLKGLVPRTAALLREVLALRQTLLVHAQPYPQMERDLTQLIPPDFLRVTPFAQLTHFPRYLKAMKARADRWKQNPAKDAERAAQLAPYTSALSKLTPATSSAIGTQTKARETMEAKSSDRAIQTFRWLVEEYRVSVFAQELGTAEPVSKVKLDRALADLTRSRSAANVGATNESNAVRRPEPTPFRPLVTTPEKKTAPLKNLSALDRLFPR